MCWNGLLGAPETAQNTLAPTTKRALHGDTSMENPSESRSKLNRDILLRPPSPRPQGEASRDKPQGPKVNTDTKRVLIWGEGSTDLQQDAP